MKKWMRKGINALQASSCRVWEFDIGEVPIKRYATPDSFTTKEARLDLWMGNMMWQLKDHHGTKINGEQARQIMFEYMSSEFYEKVNAKFHRKKVVPKEKPRLTSKDVGWLAETAPPPPEDKTTPLRRPVHKPNRKPVRKPTRVPMRKAIE